MKRKTLPINQLINKARAMRRSSMQIQKIITDLHIEDEETRKRILNSCNDIISDCMIILTGLMKIS